MKNINHILNEDIKANILYALLRKDSSFSELLKISNLRDHGQLNYHLKLMMNEGLIKKNFDKYTFTNMGERIGVYLKQIQFKEFSPLTVVCGIVYNERGEILLLKIVRNPQKGKWGLPGGKAILGETIFQTVERELYEETGIHIASKKVLGFFPSQVYKNEELSYHVNLVVVLMKSISSKSLIKIDPKEHDEYIFIKKDKIDKLDVVGNNKELIKGIVENKDFNFKELIINE